MKDSERLKHLMASLGLTKTGYAGLDKRGNKVDRRQFPDAVPFEKSTPLNIPPPRCIKCGNEAPHALIESICPKCRIELQEDKRSVATKMPIEQNPDNSKTDSLSEVIQTKEQADDFKMRLKQLTDPQNTTKEPVMKNIPEKIYLQVGDDDLFDADGDFKELSEVSWCHDRIYDTDIEYVRSKGEPVIDWEGLIGKFYEDTGETNSYTSMFFLWLKSNLSNHIK